MCAEFLSMELSRAAYKLVKDVLKIEKNEEVVITIDSMGDWRVASAIASSTYTVGGKPIVTWYPSPPAVGKAADPYLPLKTLTEIVKNSDVWIELNKSWLLYSTVYEEAMKFGKTRYMCLVGMDVDMIVRTIGRVNIPVLYEFQRRLAEITSRARKIRITSPAGMDIEFENDPSRPVLVEGEVAGPGEYMLFGQVDWAPIEETINGRIVFDGSIWPPHELGLLKEPIILEVKNGRIIDIKGGREAKIFERWLRSFNDEKMYYVAHLSYGCNPGAKLTGNILEDERVWGVVEWGIGSQSSTFKGRLGLASSHTDGICLNPTLTADDEIIIKDGEYLHPSLKEYTNRLKL
ncbi:MAG: aminopeptidase [Aigarchaeota archaeon]|nr:aminopeptidase [Aigarchaeota archaeon]MCX8193059.1 aminopeptidase [Nitrososphaeria archaeon]